MRALLIIPDDAALTGACERFQIDGPLVNVTAPKKELDVAVLMYGTLSDIRKRLRYLSLIDVLMVYDCYTMARMEWDKIEGELRLRQPSIDVRVYSAPDPEFLKEDAPPSWRCGDAFGSLKMRAGRILLSGHLPARQGDGCGHENDINHMFCRQCGCFRGVKYDIR